MKHYASHNSKLYVLKYVAHELREEIFNEFVDGKKHVQNKMKAQAWMNAVIGKFHIREMDYFEVVRLIAELECKKQTGHSLKSIIGGAKPKPPTIGWKQIIKMPWSNLALFFGYMKYK